MIVPFLKFLIRKNLRGQTRLTFALANKMKSLQSVPIHFADRSLVYVDLRNGRGHEWLRGSPWPSSPVETEEQEMIAALVKPGQIVIDVGANLGLYSTLFAKLVGPSGQVHAFEPKEELLPNLRRTLAPLSNTELHVCGLSDTVGSAVLYVPNAQSAVSSLSLLRPQPT